MAGIRPNILVVGDNGDERAAIAAVLRDAGFAVVAAARDRTARAALSRKGFAATVIALPQDDGIEFQRHLRHRHPGLPALIVIEPSATRFIGVDVDAEAIVTRPFDPRRLLGRVLELMLRDDEHGRKQLGNAAELGIAAAKLACLYRRLSAAAAAGAQALADDLMRQIGVTLAMHRGLAAATAR